MRQCVFFLLLFLVKLFVAQQPNTDVWLFNLAVKKGKAVVGKGQNITHREGYDNQPAWDAAGKNIYYVSVRADKQSDVYVYDVSKKKHLALTKTPESEYSPTPLPNSTQLACVVVEKDSTQRIWTYDAKTGVMQKPLLNEDSVGYFLPFNKDTILYYKLTEPHTLRAHALKTNKNVWICNAPIRGFKTVSSSAFIFGSKDSTHVSFYVYDTHLQKAQWVCKYPSVSEDIVWHSVWGLLKSEGTLILQWDKTLQTWQTLFDLSSFGLKRITRFCFHPKDRYLVVVDNL